MLISGVISNYFTTKKAFILSFLQIKFNYDKWFGVALAPELPPATEDECNVPDEWCSRNAYCQRNSEGQCTWGEMGSCE